jgi:hypothetical protein
VLLTAVLLLVSTGAAYGQGKPDSTSQDDTLWVIDPVTGAADMSISNDKDTNFALAVMVYAPTTAFGSIVMPFSFTGLAELNIDTTVEPVTGNPGISLAPVGRDVNWQVITSDVKNDAKTITVAFLSFTQVNPPLNDTLVYIHFDLDASNDDVRVILDSTRTLPANYISYVNAVGRDFIPQWKRFDIKVGTVSGADDGTGIKPLTYGLDQNFPNPFNAQTQISFSMPKADHVKLVVFNMLGQQVRTLVDESMQAGEHKMIWDGLNAQGTGVASGTYFYRLKIGDVFEETRQMVLLK